MATISLNPEQNAAVNHIYGPLLILAGAGSGKTRVITHRIEEMIRRGIPPSAILAVSFTNKAAREMKERVSHAVGKRQADRVHLSTFHALGVRILQRHIKHLGYRSKFTILDPGDQLSILRDVMEERGFDTYRKKAKDILSIISRAKNEYKQPKDLASMRLNPFTNHAQALFVPYVEACKALNSVDFDDLIILPVKLFSEHPDVLEKCRDLYRFIMVDEYQDTNYTQLLLLRQLAAPKNNICVVGDDDQSIYAFRGAAFHNILEFERYFSGAKVIKLEQNYRSTSRILTAANTVIKNNTKRRDKALWSALGDGERIQYYELRDESEEARTVAGDIKYQRIVNKRPWTDFAVLFRASVTSRNLEESLREENVPYKLLGGTEFFDRREVKDLLAYLRVMVNPRDEVALRRCVNTPTRGLGPTTLARLVHVANTRKSSLYDALRKHLDDVPELSQRQRTNIQKFTGLIEGYSKRFRNGHGMMDRILSDMIEELNYRHWVNQGEKSQKIQKIRLKNIDEMIQSLHSFDARGGSLDDYITKLILRDANNNEKKEDDTDQVLLMSLHASKGLEFPYVYIIGFEEDLLPHQRSISTGNAGDLEEERRLAYVGITRAKERLMLTSVRMRGKRRGKHSSDEGNQRSPSRFLKEIPEDVIVLHYFGQAQPVMKDKEKGKKMFAALKAMLD